MSPAESPSRPLLSWRPVLAMLSLSDTAMVLIGLWAARDLRFSQTIYVGFQANVPRQPALSLLAFAALWLIAYRSMGLYQRNNLVSGVGEYRRVATASLAATILVIIFDYVRVNPSISRGFLLLSMMFVALMTCIGRFVIRRFIYRQAAQGRPLDRVVVVGSSRNAAAVARQLIVSPSASADVAGFLSEYLPVGAEVTLGRRVLGEPLQLEAVAQEVGATRALVVESELSWESLHGLVLMMHHRTGLDISIIPGLFDVHATQMTARQMGPVLTLAAQPTRITGFDAVLKRGLDIAVGLVAVLVSAPIVAVLVAQSLRPHGSGWQRETFFAPSGELTLWKVPGSDWASRNHLLRLPNLLQVLRGRMSLVGPRPVPRHPAEISATARQLLGSAKPGFIGPWWLVGREKPDVLEEELSYDLYYLRNYSIWLDLHILVQVVRSMFGRTALPSGGRAAKSLMTRRDDDNRSSALPARR